MTSDVTNKNRTVINCLSMQIADRHLILPQSSIAEVIRAPEIQPGAASVDWLLGTFEWRRQQVPLLSFERLCGWVPAEDNDKYRWAIIIYALTQSHGLVFYALEIATTPHSLSISEDVISDNSAEISENDGHNENDNECIASHVLLNGQNAFIPSIPRIESLLHEQLQ